MRKPEVWAKWRRLVAEQERSGHAAVAFCGARGISRMHVFAWKARLRRAAAESFVAARIAESGPGAVCRPVEIRLGGGRSQVVEPGFDAANLRAERGVRDLSPDTTLGLQYAINRWYMPGQGRFTSADPYWAGGGPGEPSSFNQYTYVQDDPVNFREQGSTR